MTESAAGAVSSPLRAASAEALGGGGDVAGLLPLVRRVVASRVPMQLVDDLVQETVAAVLAAKSRVHPGMLEPYAIVTARNVVATMWEQEARQRRNVHRTVDLRPPQLPDEELLQREEELAVSRALARLSARERETLLAHEVRGQDTASLAEDLGSTKGAVAAQLKRTRARLRVEYLLQLEGVEPPTERCRPVLLALSGGDRRRQREVAAGQHLLECLMCSRLSRSLLDRREQPEDEVRVSVRRDADVVTARKEAREISRRAELTASDLTLVATAVSELARNIVRFAGSGEIVVRLINDEPRGVRVIAHDNGPGIPDVERALVDGFSTYNGLGLGLPGASRLMDEFEIVSEVGKGTTITMAKWVREG